MTALVVSKVYSLKRTTERKAKRKKYLPEFMMKNKCIKLKVFSELFHNLGHHNVL